MKENEIIELLQFTNKESNVFMPNEIFTDLQQAITSSPHVHFAYSYIYLTHWMYRYAKNLNSKNKIIDNKKIKEILGYNSKLKTLDYLIKKNGLIDQIKYTETVKNFPMVWIYSEEEGLEFQMYSEYKDELEIIIDLPRKFSIKFPVRAFNRTPFDEELKDDYLQGYEDGTFFDISNTHCIPFEIFIYCMANEKIGTTGFYLYSFIKRMNSMFPKWDVSINKMVRVTGIPETTLTRQLDVLRKFNMVDVILNQEVFSLAMKLSERKANSYKVNEFEKFTDQPQAYKKMKIITTNQYYKKFGKEEQPNGKIEIPLEQLPF